MKHAPISYNPKFVLAFFRQAGIPDPSFEFHFAKKELGRDWRFDLAWPDYKVAIEVQGGIWKKDVRSAHARGSGLLKDYEKANAAACLGWRVMYLIPEELMKLRTTQLVASALFGSPYPQA